MMGEMETHVDAIIFDIDGTLADLSHRRHYVSGTGKPDWKSFNAEMVNDPPLVNVCYLAELLGSHPLAPSFVKLFLFSGRMETHRKVTEDWLTANVPAYFKASVALMMRAEDDFRGDTLVKKDMLHEIQSQGYNVRLVVDDRPSVVQMWKDEGLTVLAHDSEWNQYRCWPTGSLHMMVGPSCAGKSSWLEKRFFFMADTGCPRSALISSDNLRIEIAGGTVYGNDHADINDQVHSYMTAALRVRMDHGLTTIIDACNIHARRRRPLLDSCPKDANIVYHVHDRPLDIKLRDAGLRDKMFMPDGLKIIESHHRAFKSALPTILKGDSDPRVTVHDHRRPTQ